eukprot:TRINITY_DN9165_c0_g1_i1.p1 TRINITY_DN9165_c0_g1~~TRINITY_DN9165_c0_g1_i1.p1  ORF type:complete len:199 (+),score=90.83 TRINITY_DN9165_c0_g1_i1:48-599(+)
MGSSGINAEYISSGINAEYMGSSGINAEYISSGINAEYMGKSVMGATQSELAQYQDEGPAVSEVRIIKAIREHEKTNDVAIEEIKEKSGNVKGAGFMGALVQLEVRVTVDGQVKKYNWMVKSTPREPNRYLIARKFYMDEREVTFYKGLLPKLKLFAESKTVLIYSQLFVQSHLLLGMPRIRF